MATASVTGAPVGHAGDPPSTAPPRERRTADASPEDLSAARSLTANAAKRYESADTYAIAFEQASYWALADSLLTIGGVLRLNRPSDLSISYDDGGRIASDGESLRVYVPRTNQFFVAPIDSSDIVIDPARLLRLYEPDRTSPFAEPEGERDGRFATVNLTPRGTLAEPTRLHITIDRTDNVVTRIVAFTSSGDQTTYTLLSTRFDLPLDRDAFVLKRPPGAELITGSPYASE